jgi:hypothetical protein
VPNQSRITAVGANSSEHDAGLLDERTLRTVGTRIAFGPGSVESSAGRLQVAGSPFREGFMLDRLLQLGVVAFVVVMGVSAVAQPVSQADAAKAIQAA